MKKMKKTFYTILTFAAAVVLIASCNKLEDFGDTNVNPAATSSPNTAALLTNVLSDVGGTNYAAHRGAALYCQYFSETQYPDFSCYSLNQASPAGVYAGYLYDLENIIITNTDEATKDVAALNGSNNNQIAIARILKAYIYWTLTDRWGDIPYKDALKGDPNVTYDTQESIYKDLIKELTESVSQLAAGGALLKGDIVYGGDVAKWKKFANSLRMLMALRLSKQYPGASDYAATEFKAALANAAGHISTNADNFKVSYVGGANATFQNPFYRMYDGRKDYGESATMTTILGSLGNDYRQSVFGATNNGAATNLGVPYGRKREFIDPWCGANPTYAWVFAPAYRTKESPIYVIHASALLLARAEAADKGWTSETANTQALYESGIKASFAMWGLSEPDAAYFTNAAVALPNAPGTGANLPFIALQQWIAFYPDGIQGWSNWRRTGIPALTPALDATNSPKVIPRRYVYGTADYSLTAAGIAAAVSRLTGGDKMDSKVWWDK
jgi:hypothetical protein